MPGGGKRIFVGAKTPTEAGQNLARNTVLLKIKSLPALPGQAIALKAFDVDDATDESADAGGVIDSNGRLGDDNFADYLATPKTGVFVASGLASHTATLDANGEALVEFRVGMQPGNNYRIAVTPFPTASNLNVLQVNNPAGPMHVTADAQQPPEFNGDISPLLTVWRKLHIEVDSMAAPPTSGPNANYVTGVADAVRTDRPQSSQSVVFTRQLPTSDRNQYQNGRIEIAGTSYPVLSSATPLPHEFPYHSFVVQGTIPGNVVHQPFKLYDDDGRLAAELGLPSLPMDGFSGQIVNGKALALTPGETVPGIKSAFSPAFILVVDANQMGINPRRTIPFSANRDLFDVLLEGVFDDAKDIGDSESFWAHTVTMGYQPAEHEDLDPHAEAPLVGVTAETPGTWHAHGFSVIYTETIRDTAYEGGIPASYQPANHFDLEQRYYRLLFGTIAHETGHAPGRNWENTDHNEQGLMQKGGNSITIPFTPQTLLRFRLSTSWRNGQP